MASEGLSARVAALGQKILTGRLLFLFRVDTLAWSVTRV